MIEVVDSPPFEDEGRAEYAAYRRYYGLSKTWDVLPERERREFRASARRKAERQQRAQRSPSPAGDRS